MPKIFNIIRPAFLLRIGSFGSFDNRNSDRRDLLRPLILLPILRLHVLMEQGLLHLSVLQHHGLLHHSPLIIQGRILSWKIDSLSESQVETTVDRIIFCSRKNGCFEPLSLLLLI